MTQQRSTPGSAPSPVTSAERPGPEGAVAFADPPPGTLSWWAARCREVADWSAEQGLSTSELVWFVPRPHHLALAEAAWARHVGGWMPRVLARPQVPAAAAASPGLRLDPASDPWRARQHLLSMPWARDWARQDPRGLDALAARLQALARGWYVAAWLQGPQRREGWIAQVRARLDEGHTPVGPERALARLAFEWAVVDDGRSGSEEFPAGTRGLALLLGPHGEEARVGQALQEGGQAAGLPVLQMRAPDTGPARPASVTVCAGFEDEARETVGRVLVELSDRPADAPPVALITEDRRLARRARALLESAGARVADETGWTLSTTRAGAMLMAWMRWAAPSAGAAEMLAALHSIPEPDERLPEPALAALEAYIEGAGWRAAEPVVPGLSAREGLDLPALALWDRACAVRAAWAWEGGLPWSRIAPRWREAGQDFALWSQLEGDDAGRQILQALHWEGTEGPPLEGTATYSDVLSWVDSVLEACHYRPSEPPRPEVRLLPLQRAVWREFQAIVMPAVDAQSLGGAPQAWPWLGAGEAEALGLMPPAEKTAAERWAFEQLLQRPRVHLLRRQSDVEGPVAPSPWLQRLDLQTRREGRAWPVLGSAQVTQEVSTRPVFPPRPRVDGHRALWPQVLSATRYESLRACPYQFMSRAFLGLREVEIPADGPDAREQGQWLHEVLHRFHAEAGSAEATRGPMGLDRLHQLAEEVGRQQGLTRVDFLPWSAWFESFAPRYLAWWEAQADQGVVFVGGELACRSGTPALAELGLRLEGRIDRLDRLDRVEASGSAALRVIDYKSGSGQAQKDILRRPQEDSQLAFYAALMLDREPEEIARSDGLTPGPLEAAYLPLSAAPLTLLPHPKVDDDARDLLDGLAQDWRALGAGAALPALGEGRACERCEMSGLCRKAHWCEMESQA